MRLALISCLFAAALISSNFSKASASTIGPGSGLAGPLVVDTIGGTRTNVDLSSTLFLPAGQYNATNFSFNAGQPGDVQPFLAIVTGTSGGHNLYSVIAAGNDNTVSTNGIQTVLFGGSSAFTVPAGGETVFAGIENVSATTTSGNPVFTNLSVGSDDHEAPGFGGPFTTSTTFGPVNNPAIGRSYAFNITLAAVPEPSTFILSGLGLVGLLVAARRRKA